MRAELIGHFKACMTEIYLHIDARMADYIRTHPYCRRIVFYWRSSLSVIDSVGNGCATAVRFVLMSCGGC